MSNCFNQDENAKTSLISLKKVDQLQSQSLQDLNANKITLKDFLSQGQIGRIVYIQLILEEYFKLLRKVFKVKMKNSSQEYAMKEYAVKVIKKSEIIQFGLVEHTILEKSVLIRSKNPFVVKLKYSFQTDQKLYLVMELVAGGQLSKILNKYHQN